jgi:hypothetical protein
VEANSYGIIRLTCQNSSISPLSAVVTSYSDDGVGTLYQAIVNDNVTVAGDKITTFPTAVTSVSAEVVYTAASGTDHDSFNFSTTCNGLTESGYVYIIVTSAPVAATDITHTVVINTPTMISLYGTNEVNGLMVAEITSLPSLGTLYQFSFDEPDVLVEISTVPTTVKNPFHLISYKPNTNTIGSDSFGFKMSHGSLSSSVVTVSISIESWDFPPSIPLLTNLSVTDRREVTVALEVGDLDKPYVGVYITSLPKKGKIYQVNEDGSRGERYSE